MLTCVTMNSASAASERTRKVVRASGRGTRPSGPGCEATVGRSPRASARLRAFPPCSYVPRDTPMRKPCQIPVNISMQLRGVDRPHRVRPVATAPSYHRPGAVSSVGRARALQARGRWFEPSTAHANAPCANLSRMSEPLSFDPIAQARSQWTERWGEEPARPMAAVTSIMRAQQILLARLGELLRPFGLTFPRYETLMVLVFSRT